MSTEKHRILAIDDSPLLRRSFSDILGKDYELDVEYNGERGIESAKENKPSLILLDIVMPGMSGFEVISILKAEPLTKDIPVIFITGDDSTASKEKGYQLGAADYIEKPLAEIVVKKRVEFNLRLSQYEKKFGVLEL